MLERAAASAHQRPPLAKTPAKPYIRYQETVWAYWSKAMADGTTPIVPTVPDEAVTPGGINHLVINVRDMEESHKFWTEVLGFKLVGKSSRRPMRFYSGDHAGQMTPHDIALVETPNLPKRPENWEMFDAPVAINHIAITMPN